MKSKKHRLWAVMDEVEYNMSDDILVLKEVYICSESKLASLNISIKRLILKVLLAKSKPDTRFGDENT